MSPDYTAAATKAAETLIRYGIRIAPVSTLKILEQLNNVITVSFADMSSTSGIRQRDLMPLFGRNQDAVVSIHTENGRKTYVVAYNNLLPFAMVQRALAREMGHILLGHEECSPENTLEANTFAHHLLCPRPLIHSIQATGLRVTKNVLANLTGTFDQDILSMRQVPPVTIPSGLNRFIRSQFMPFILNFFEYCQHARPDDRSAVADLGTYMDGYEE